MKKTSRLGLQRNFSTLFLLAAFAVPLQSPDGWQHLHYKKIPAHTIEHRADGLSIQVKSSASPVMYRLPQAMQVKTVSVKGLLEGGLKLKGKQGEKGSDDFVLRVGLVVKGKRRLNFFERAIAPDWVKRLHDLAPKGVGVDHIEFLNIVSDKTLLGGARKHPQSDLLRENFVWFLEKPGAFDFQTTLSSAVEVLALWIAVDGDDSKSSYTLKINSLDLMSPDLGR